MPYRQLDADRILPTQATLQRRIEERFPGSVLAAVNDIETLTTSLSAKIWQKITLLGDQRAVARS